MQDNKQLNLAQNIHKQSGVAVEYILKNALLRRTLDNVTVVLIAFNNFKHAVFGQGKPSGKYSLNSHDQIDNSQIKKKENIPPEQLQDNSSKEGVLSSKKL